MKVITVSNEKGGVGKTSFTINTAAQLAARGHRVLVVDSDAQAHATVALGVQKYPGLYELLVRDANWREVLRPVATERYGGQPGDKTNLFILGSNVESRTIASLIGEVWKLKRRLAEVDNAFDFCLVDTSPTPSLLHGAIYLSSDYMIYPTLPEAWSFDGLAESFAHRNQIIGMKDVGVAGIVPFRCRLKTVEHTENLNMLRQQFGDAVWTPIPESIVWAESATFGLPVFVYAPDHEAARIIEEMAQRVEALNV